MAHGGEKFRLGGGGVFGLSLRLFGLQLGRLKLIGRGDEIVALILEPVLGLPEFRDPFLKFRFGLDQLAFGTLLFGNVDWRLHIETNVGRQISKFLHFFNFF